MAHKCFCIEYDYNGKVLKIIAYNLTDDKNLYDFLDFDFILSVELSHLANYYHVDIPKIKLSCWSYNCGHNSSNKNIQRTLVSYDM